jgi:hypothetical protein
MHPTRTKIHTSLILKTFSELGLYLSLPKKGGGIEREWDRRRNEV